MDPPRDPGLGLAALSADLDCEKCGSQQHGTACCPYFARPRELHPDATSRGAVPHITQINKAYVLANTPQGQASGAANNCLIDTLRQLVHWQGNVRDIRKEINKQFRSGPHRVAARVFLDFGAHSAAVLELMRKDPSMYRLVCVDLDHGDHGAVLGEGPVLLFVGNQKNMHFVGPLATCAVRAADHIKLHRLRKD